MTDTAGPESDGVITAHDDRPIGVSIERDQLCVGDVCNVTVEAQMQGLPTGSLLTLKQVVYRGMEDARRRFDSPLEQFLFSDFEIVRVALCGGDRLGPL